MIQAYPWNTKVLAPKHSIRNVHEGYAMVIHRDDHPDEPYHATVTCPRGEVIHTKRHRFLANARRACMASVLDTEATNLRRKYTQTNRQLGS